MNKIEKDNQKNKPTVYILQLTYFAIKLSNYCTLTATNRNTEHQEKND